MTGLNHLNWARMIGFVAVWRMALSTNITVLELSERSADITSAWNAIKLLSMRWHLKVGSTGRYVLIPLSCSI